MTSNQGADGRTVLIVGGITGGVFLLILWGAYEPERRAPSVPVETRVPTVPRVPDGALRVSADTWPVLDRFDEWPLTVDTGWVACTDETVPGEFLGQKNTESIWFYDDTGHRWALDGFTQSKVRHGLPGFDPNDERHSWIRKPSRYDNDGNLIVHMGGLIDCANTLCPASNYSADFCPIRPGQPSSAGRADAPSPAPPWRREGTGAMVFDKPATVTRVRITAQYDGYVQNFAVVCDGMLVVNETLGSDEGDVPAAVGIRRRLG